MKLLVIFTIKMFSPHKYFAQDVSKYIYMYRITAVLKVETDIIASIAASLVGLVVILVIMYVEIFNTDIIVFIGIKCHNVTSH